MFTNWLFGGVTHPCNNSFMQQKLIAGLLCWEYSSELDKAGPCPQEADVFVSYLD